jgi:hypothetical protein
VDGKFDEVPKDLDARRKWLAATRAPEVTPAVRTELEKWYGADKASRVKAAEAFELCEYGRRPSDDEIRKRFPMLR